MTPAGPTGSSGGGGGGRGSSNRSSSDNPITLNTIGGDRDGTRGSAMALDTASG
eukprot:CAMPEP_0198355520 /NCGR_PEP_ID=MMETSP1450-20131203/119383_1 /TAXON_ID=753684 ORGANISM="Madagascaria erythrocladiodes, Strain CCMP3234" /NCGR_SAMPLE_ID=MMETSP1450 /ASSEMBLY_ACC=CAM_ASM_001115 /LENGTH=53 /DNA_ID=CAMNT_0044061893 /DNA_START=479 /DNA_END=636 /DNA_ORIENTATION=-